MPKMKASRRASRPAGAPPNNIPAPYPRHPLLLPLSPLRDEAVAALLSAIRTPLARQGTFYIYYEDTRENAEERQDCQPTETKIKRKIYIYVSLLRGA